MSHQQHDIFESRKQFQLERIILFSDAIFAIAITLLIIEIKIPHFDTAPSPHQLAEALEEKIPEFISFVLSFAVIGQFWTNHHKLFGYITNYTSGLLWLNLLMLLFVVVMPFSTFLIMQFGNLDIIWLWYSTNLAMIGFALYLMWRYVSKHKALTYISDNVSFMKLSRRRSLVLTAIFLFGGLLTFLPWDSVKYFSRFVFILIFPVLRLMSRQYDKKYPNKRPAH